MSKLILKDGCTTYSITYRSKDITDLSIKELQGLLEKILSKIKTNKGESEYRSWLKSLIAECLQEYGTLEVSDYCDQCGDTINKFSMEI